MSDIENAKLGGDNEQLQRFFERAVRLMGEIDSLKGDLKDVLAEAKAAGFDPKLIKKAIQLAKKKAAERNEEEEMLPIYFAVLQKANTSL